MLLYLLMGRLEQENLFRLKENHQISKDCFRCALRIFFVLEKRKIVKMDLLHPSR